MTLPGSPVEPGDETAAGAMTHALRSVGRPLSLDDFVVLNDEIRAFVRAGIPLDVGLRGTTARSDGRLREVAARIADRTAHGQSLPEALHAEGTTVPAEYRALLTAGLRTGRLADVLTSISELGESVARLRRQLRVSLVYPTIVFLLAYGLFVGLMVFVIPTLERTRDLFRAEDSVYFRTLTSASGTVGVWGIGLPAGLVILWMAVKFSRTMSGSGAASLDGMRWLPGAKDIGVSRFARVLSVLVEFGVPLPEAVRLCGDASGSGKLQIAAGALATDLESGASLEDALANVRSLPAFLKWLMALGVRQGSLAPSLRQAAAVYEQRAFTRLDRFRRIVPPAVVLIFGGLITLTYALSVFVPMTELLRSLEGAPR